MTDIPIDPYRCSACTYRTRVIYPCIAHLAATGLEKIHHPEELRQAMLAKGRPERVMPPNDVVPQVEQHDPLTMKVVAEGKLRPRQQDTETPRSGPRFPLSYERTTDGGTPRG